MIAGQDPLPFIIGTPVAGVTPATGVFLDISEVTYLLFDSIAVGSDRTGQAIWVQTAPGEELVFSRPLTINASRGETHFSGQMEGTGLTLNGSGSTTHFQGVDMLQTGHVTIDDALDVSADSIVEVADADPSTRLVLTINGDITVRANTTLQLLADDIVLEHAPVVPPRGSCWKPGPRWCWAAKPSAPPRV